MCFYFISALEGVELKVVVQQATRHVGCSTRIVSIWIYLMIIENLRRAFALFQNSKFLIVRIFIARSKRLQISEPTFSYKITLQNNDYIFVFQISHKHVLSHQKCVVKRDRQITTFCPVAVPIYVPSFFLRLFYLTCSHPDENYKPVGGPGPAGTRIWLDWDTRKKVFIRHPDRRKERPLKKNTRREISH